MLLSSPGTRRELTLDQAVGVRIPVPQPTLTIDLFGCEGADSWRRVIAQVGGANYSIAFVALLLVSECKAMLLSEFFDCLTAKPKIAT